MMPKRRGAGTDSANDETPTGEEDDSLPGGQLEHGPIPIDTAWFKGVIRDKKTSQRQVAFKMGLDPASMSLMLRGHRKMSVVEAGELAQLIGQPLEEVIRRAGGSANMVGHLRTPSEIAALGGARGIDRPTPDSGEVLRHVLAVSNVEVAGWVDAAGVIHRGKAAGPATVERPPGVPAGAVALRLQSGDMWDGWLVFYRPAPGVGADAVGQMCVVERDDGVLQLRFVQRGYTPGRWNLGGGLWPREEDVVLHGASPVLWLKQR